MSIKLKLLFASAGIGVMLLIILLLTLNTFNGLSDGFTGIVERSALGVNNAQQSNDQVLSSNAHLLGVANEMNTLSAAIVRSNQNVQILAKKIEGISTQLDELATNSEQLLEQIPESELLYELEDMVSSMGDIKELMRREALISVNSTIGQMNQFTVEVKQKSDELNSVTGELEKVTTLSQEMVKANQEIVSLTGEFQHSIELSSHFIIVVIIVATVVSILLNLGISHVISSRIKDAVKCLFDIAEGEGDLTRRLKTDGKDEISQLARGFNLFAQKIEDMIRAISQTTSQLTHTIEQVSSITDETLQSAKQQQLESDSVVIAIENMSQSVEEVAQSAANTAVSAQQVEEQAQTGENTVTNNRNAIQALSAEVANAAQVIHDLQQESTSISTILEAISSVSDQTNLLALNAAIEAARAGEHGRGFAVVADEVRGLAQQAQESTVQIQQLTTSLQDKALRAVSVMESGQKSAEESVGHAHEVGQSLSHISQSISNIVQMSQAIAQSTENQTSVTGDMTSNIKSIDAIADVTAQGAVKIDKSLEEIDSQVKRLEALVHQFKIS